MQYFSSYLFLIIALSLNAAANILIKISADKGFKPSGATSLLNYIIHNSMFLLGLIFFGLNVIFYYLALRSVPLVSAYPIMVGMSFLIISFFSFWYLHERITLTHIISSLFILIGIIGISLKSS